MKYFISSGIICIITSEMFAMFEYQKIEFFFNEFDPWSLNGSQVDLITLFFFTPKVRINQINIVKVILIKRGIFWYWGLECRTLTDKNWIEHHSVIMEPHRTFNWHCSNVYFFSNLKLSSTSSAQKLGKYKNPFTSDYVTGENLWITFVLLNLHLGLYCKNQIFNCLLILTDF